MMKDGLSGEFWTVPAGNLMYKSIHCDSDVGVVYELVAYDMGELLVCSKCVNDEVATLLFMMFDHRFAFYGALLTFLCIMSSMKSYLCMRWTS